MAGVLSKGITLSYKKGSSGSFTQVLNVQEIPDIGGTKESVEVTTLSDSAHMYINGLEDYGDSLDFTILYTKTGWDTLSALSGEYSWQVQLPPDGEAAGGVCTFNGEPSVKINGTGTNAAMTFTLAIKPTTAMTFA